MGGAALKCIIGKNYYEFVIIQNRKILLFGRQEDLSLSSYAETVRLLIALTKEKRINVIETNIGLYDDIEYQKIIEIPIMNYESTYKSVEWEINRTYLDKSKYYFSFEKVYKNKKTNGIYLATIKKNIIDEITNVLNENKIIINSMETTAISTIRILNSYYRLKQKCIVVSKLDKFYFIYIYRDGKCICVDEINNNLKVKEQIYNLIKQENLNNNFYIYLDNLNGNEIGLEENLVGINRSMDINKMKVIFSPLGEALKHTASLSLMGLMLRRG
ncbi:hypothetical protein [Thermobrachium celere]|uniref:hypothetical protein n=1 Tax=Thermobrachium celere TaxID=53422 RepID=UPI001944189C|nr:hypothetical protein [Thermobrachium celere]GFR36411.1 hypothetical protein TCEA9_22230 [Thermobrachium celere]